MTEGEYLTEEGGFYVECWLCGGMVPHFGVEQHEQWHANQRDSVAVAVEMVMQGELEVDCG